MSAGSISAQQLRSAVEEKWQRDETAVAVGLHVTAGWHGPDEVSLGEGKAAVVRADTVLQVRETLRTAERQRRRVVVLTSLQQAELGHDVVARFARGRLFPVNPWASLGALFKAKELDRSISDPAVAQALLDFAPADGYPPVSAGVLDAGAVWRAVGRHVFEMGDREPDLAALLLWAGTTTGPARYLAASDELKESVQKRFVALLGDAAGSVFRFVAAGAGPDALALALACQVIFGEGAESPLDAAAARMEQYHGHTAISVSAGRALARAAADAVAELDRLEDHRAIRRHTQRADEYLRLFRCEDHAHRGRFTLRGFEGRLTRFGAELRSALPDPAGESIQRCEALLAEVAAHRLARWGRYRERASQAEMAVRLLRWLARPSEPPVAFTGLAIAYAREVSFVDWARESIGRGDDSPDLSAAYRGLTEAILARREAFSHAFATALADWTAAGSKSPALIGVEDVLDEVVARAAKADNRVLLIVLDGMSWAICHELLDDLRREHWFEARLSGSEAPPAVIATLPSVTRFSRTSLLSGALTAGDAAVEKRNFEAHPGLRQAGDRRQPPALFHKREVTDGGRGTVADDLKDAVLAESRRVVGVVINAIDDRLANAPQIRDDWSIGRIGPLGPLLKLARDSGRLVVLASDHGHVWHRLDDRTPAGETGSRWRPGPDPVEEGEVAVSGSRVLAEGGGQTLIVPWAERIHYGRAQNGYHGGASPQEMVCPLVLLRDGSSAYAGLAEYEHLKPDWWWAAPAAVPAVEEPTAVVPARGQAGLFDHVADSVASGSEGSPATSQPISPPAAGWIGRLLASPAYKSQKAMVRRHAPDDALVQAALEALDRSGGVMTPAAFARSLAFPAASLDGLVARLQRLLNVDGYEILGLSRAENRVALNAAMLMRQFDLE